MCFNDHCLHFVLLTFSLSPTVHCGNIRQTAQIIAMSQDCLRTGDRAMVHFRFIKNPEYLQVGMKILFREGRTKAVGSVTKLIVGTPPLSSSSHKFVHKN